MNTSVKSQSPLLNAKLEAERTALRKLFWAEGVMKHFREQGETFYQCGVAHQITASELLEMVFGEGPIQKPAPHDTVVFQIVPIQIADEQWGSVIARLENQPWLRIIDPFPVPNGDLSKIALFREEC